MVLDKDEISLERGKQKITLRLREQPEVLAFVASIRGTLSGNRAALSRTTLCTCRASGTTGPSISPRATRASPSWSPASPSAAAASKSAASNTCRPTETARSCPSSPWTRDDTPFRPPRPALAARPDPVRGVALRAHYTADMSAFLPRSPTPAQQLLVDQLTEGVLSRLLLVGIEGSTPAARAELSRPWPSPGGRGLFLSVRNGDAAILARDRELLFSTATSSVRRSSPSASPPKDFMQPSARASTFSPRPWG
jgi:hypothetical protein